MAQLLENLVALQSAFDELREAQRRLSGLPDWMAELHEEHSLRKGEIDALEEEIEGIEGDRREAEGVIGETRQLLERYQEQINQVTTQREYGALLHEIDAAKGNIREMEERIQAGAERKEQAQEEIAQLQEDFQELDERYTGEVKKWEEQRPEVEKRTQELETTIESVRGQLSRGALMQYDRISERLGGDALAPVRKLERVGTRKGPTMWHCGACNYNVRPQIVVEITRGSSLIQCDNCKRILFLPPEEEAAAGMEEAVGVEATA